MGGKLWAWGVNSYGQLGNGTTTASRQPTAVTNTKLTSAVAIACGWGHCLAIDDNGKLWSWGMNNYGQLGDGTTANKYEPTPVINTSLPSATAIACGSYYSVAIDSNGKLWAWGQNNYGQLGDGTIINKYEPTPVINTSLTSATVIACGVNHNLAIDGNGKLWAWGSNGWGELGIGNPPPPPPTYSSVPLAVISTDLHSATAIACGSYHCLAIDSNGKLWAWGSNQNSQLGDGSADLSKRQPSTVVNTSLTSATLIAGGDNSSFAIDSSGKVWAWGLNNYGQLGDGTTANKNVPTAVINTSLTIAGAIAQKYSHNLAIDTTRKAWAWGWNNYGQLGDGTTTNRSVPTAVINSKLTSVSTIAVGFYHSLAIDAPPPAPTRGIPFFHK